MKKFLLGMFMLGMLACAPAPVVVIREGTFTPEDITSIRDCTVMVETIRPDGSAFGSGTLIDSKTVVTAWHIWSNAWSLPAEALYVNVYIDEMKTKIPATLKKIGNPIQDFAVITLSKPIKLPFYPRISQKEPESGCPLLACGYPLEEVRPFITDGRFQYSTSQFCFTMSVPIIFGNSGGGVWYKDMDGELLLLGIAVRIESTHGVPIPHISHCCFAREAL